MADVKGRRAAGQQRRAFCCCFVDELSFRCRLRRLASSAMMPPRRRRRFAAFSDALKYVVVAYAAIFRRRHLRFAP